MSSPPGSPTFPSKQHVEIHTATQFISTQFTDTQPDTPSSPVFGPSQLAQWKPNSVT